ncbi:MAG: 4-hydroxythreonine-4-phosphate dehydrogenase PdxA [Thermodesulfobacteriota bacterium]|nr:MAG: 4-hydroxythreonine-4-phosphate dehydrogenase PdxA [Thermodesulfobacteriota bacterium]
MKPNIAITMGDPAGVGPELALKALGDKRVRALCNPIVVGDAGLLSHLAGKLGLKAPRESEVIGVSRLDLKRLKPGKPVKAAGEALISYIEEAVFMTAIGDADAMVTCPISKEAAKLAGFRFPGHTEFIAELTDTEDFVMMLGGKDLKVALVTIHEALKNVPRLVTEKAVLKALRVTHRAFTRDFGMKRPRIAVCGLNPHAGEGGIFGDEEKKAIAPAVKKARKEGINALGPLPADTVFYRTVRKKEFDCVLAMYHDQGLGPLKLQHFEDGVNATLGLPIIRTSVDHGTAYDIAWKGVASHFSLRAAIEMAVEMAVNRKRRP